MTPREKKLQDLLKKSLTVIDDWSLLTGAQSEKSFKDLLELMLASCAETGVDPNSLLSLQETDWEIDIKRKK
jgi:hypothetical protein